jgi:hypothetical protein
MPTRMRGQVFEIDRMRYDFEQGKIWLHGSQRTLLMLDYYQIRDQAGTIWYWWVSGTSLQLVRDTAPPVVAHTTLRDISVDPIPYWIQLVDVQDTTWYVLPTALGQVLVQATQPVVGTGDVGSPVWMAQDGRLYNMSVNPFGQYTIEGTT